MRVCEWKDGCCVCVDGCCVCVYEWNACVKWVWDAGSSRAQAWRQRRDREGEEGVGRPQP